MSAHTIASKVRRALRNETGVSLTLDQLRELVREDNLLNSLSEREASELCPAKPATTCETPTGLTRGAMGSRPISGRSRAMSEGRSFIAALASGS